MRLDYEGTPFVKPKTDDATMYAIRFTSDKTKNNLKKSVASSALGNEDWGLPYTGNGFLSSAGELDLSNGYPGKVIKDSNKIIPEYIAPREGLSNEPPLPFNDGAEMYKITESGEEILYAVYDDTKKYFKMIGD